MPSDPVSYPKEVFDFNMTSHKFLQRFARIEAFFGFLYSFIFLNLGATFTGLIFLITTLTLYPLMMFLNKRKHETSARMLLIIGGLIYIYTATISIRFDLNAEFYYLPVMMLSLLLFDIRQKKEVIIGIGLPLAVWATGHWGSQPYLPVSWAPSEFPQEMLRNLSFIGSFCVTAIFLNQYRQYVLTLKQTVEHELEITKEVERNLQEAQRLSKLGNWKLDIANNKLCWSDEVFRIFEIDKKQFSASYEAFLAVIHPDDRDEVNARYANSVISREPYEIVHRLLMPDGRIKFVRERCETSYGDDLKPIHSIGTVQDISESQKNDARLQYSSKMAALGEMASGIAHEINNPLSIIQGKAKLILRKAESKELNVQNLKEELAKIVATSERISKIINGLRAISRNAEDDAMMPTSIQKIIEDVLELSSERFKSDAVELRLHITNSNQIMCRSVEISQVILNLVNNSFDAIVNLDEKWVEIKAIESGSNIQIIVTDSGSGIAQAILGKLMQPFFTTKEVGKGTGLGLSISKRIIERHNGSLYYNTDSKNTCFIVELPISAVNSGSDSDTFAPDNDLQKAG